MLTDCQLAKIRFAYRVYSTGNSFGAPAAAVKAADDLVRQITHGRPEGRKISSQEFKTLATAILKKGN